MLPLLVTGVLIGLDNLQVTSALGLLNIQPTRQWQMAFFFGLFEALMPLVGLLIGAGVAPLLGTAVRWAGPLALLLAGGLNIVMSLKEQDNEALNNGRWLILGLPFSLSFDNLFAGVGLRLLGYPVLWAALAVGCISGLFSFTGLWLGQKVRRRLPEEAELIAGILLVVTAVTLFIYPS